jgi:alkyl hydroperoxide reductase subunit AhpF
LELALHRQDGSELEAELEELAALLLGALGSAVSLTSGEGQDLPTRPALSLRATSGRSIHYLALPQGRETAPFVDLVLALLAPQVHDIPVELQPLAELEQPAELMVFVSSACPHCAQAVRNAAALALACPHISLCVVDAERFPELAGRFGVRSVPFTLLDRRLGQTGVVPTQELVDWLMARERPGFALKVFVSLVENHRFDDAADTLAEPGGPLLFAEAWRDSTFGVRMGLMILAEQVLEADQAALDPLVELLLPFLGSLEASLRGDTADLLGQIGHPRAARALRTLCSDPHPDVAELASEAVEALGRRGVSARPRRSR